MHGQLSRGLTVLIVSSFHSVVRLHSRNAPFKEGAQAHVPCGSGPPAAEVIGS